jgi:CTD small phosphatase-like protein 2
MNKFYELIIFTAGMPDYANWVLDNLDKEKLISYRLFRHHACRAGNVFLKDLSRIGRDLSKIIIIDNI